MSSDPTPQVVDQDGQHVVNLESALTEALDSAGGNAAMLDGPLRTLAAATVFAERANAMKADARTQAEDALAAFRRQHGDVRTFNVAIGGTKVGQVTIKDVQDSFAFGNDPASKEKLLAYVQVRFGAEAIDYVPVIRDDYVKRLKAEGEIVGTDVYDQDGNTIPGAIVSQAPAEPRDFGLSFVKGKKAGDPTDLGKITTLNALAESGLADVTRAINTGVQK